MTDRRGALKAAAGALAAAAVAEGAAQPARWRPEPEQRPARRHAIDVGGTRLDCWDTGGPGEAVVLLHPNTGSNAVWGYQQPVFADAGYRVIAYSRRGRGLSEPGSVDTPGTAVDDLFAVLDALEVERCHLIGSAAGGFIVPDAALSRAERLRTITIACSLAGIVEERWRSDSAMLTPPGFRQMPPDFRELCGSYRFANPAGRARWIELEHAATASGRRVDQPARNRIDFAALGRITVPALIVTGDADPYLPPARARALAAMIPRARSAVIAEAGHSAYWEQPDAFNRTVLDFLRAHAGRG
ncbi:alpha/beta hydrolase [Sphingomonas gilva]|uniref:Alpha/beta hydrolase n=1 Tax=Sphingomonas gilva TaxID=2305907 RepID=A0A396RS66_9SPHN|nr:alpha/beta hydrolase [Sphingomonas gilva]RHW19239.1 alpha/beta hydrolase [Sphingomonas gilva]